MQAIIIAWPTLPDGLRGFIAAMAKSAMPPGISKTSSPMVHPTQDVLAPAVKSKKQQQPKGRGEKKGSSRRDKHQRSVKPTGHACRRRPGTSYADALALDDIDDDHLEPTYDFALGLNDDDDLLEQRRPDKQKRSAKTVPAFATLADDDQLADIVAAMETADDRGSKLDPLEYLLLHPAVCSHAGGSVAALVLNQA